MVEFFVMAGLGGLAFLLLWREDLLKGLWGWALGGVLLAMGLRWFVLPYDSAGDAALWSQWAEYFRLNGGFSALAAPGCPYPLALQYLLALFSWFDYPSLYLIKYVIFLAEIVLAWGCGRLADRFTRSRARQLSVFLTVLLLPSGILCGGYAAMGESLWCALAVLAAEQALSDHPWRAVILWGFALSFGLAAVFLLPVFLILSHQGRLRFYHGLLLFPVFAAVILPALWPNRPLGDILMLFPPLTALGSAPLFQGSPGIYCLKAAPLSPWPGIAVFALLCAALVWWLSLCGKSVKDQSLAAALAFTSIGAAMLFPWLGEDSLYAAEVLCLVLCAVSLRMIPAAVCCSAVSLLAVCTAQFRRLSVPLYWGFVPLLAAMVMLTVFMVSHSYRKKRKSR